MSASGHKRTNGSLAKPGQCPLWSKSGQTIATQRMSALCHKRTHAPQQTVSLFDHVVGECQQLRWHFEAERLGGLEVDHELEFGGLHDRQVGGLLPLENPPRVDASLAIGVGYAGRVA